MGSSNKVSVKMALPIQRAVSFAALLVVGPRVSHGPQSSPICPRIAVVACPAAVGSGSKLPCGVRASLFDLAKRTWYIGWEELPLNSAPRLVHGPGAGHGPLSAAYAAAALESAATSGSSSGSRRASRRCVGMVECCELREGWE